MRLNNLLSLLVVGVGNRADGCSRVSDSNLGDLMLVAVIFMSVVVLGSLVVTTVVVVSGVFIVSSSKVVSQGRGGHDKKGSTELHDESGEGGFVI